AGIAALVAGLARECHGGEAEPEWRRAQALPRALVQKSRIALGRKLPRGRGGERLDLQRAAFGAGDERPEAVRDRVVPGEKPRRLAARGLDEGEVPAVRRPG